METKPSIECPRAPEELRSVQINKYELGLSTEYGSIEMSTEKSLGVIWSFNNKTFRLNIGEKMFIKGDFDWFFKITGW